MLQKYIVLLLISLLLGGCAIGRKQDYTLATPTLAYTGKGILAAGVHDQRPYILDHDKDEDFVGIQRGGYGNPFDVTTESKKPLAEDMTQVLINALSHSGARINPLKLPPSLSRVKVIEEFKASNADKLLLLSLYEWKTDTMMGSELI
ncbi:MAG: hypothetical protein ABL903_17015 [Methylococcales bacterium]